MILIYGVTPTIIKQLVCHIIENLLEQAFKSGFISFAHSRYWRTTPVPPHGLADLFLVRGNPAVQI
jgi:hypothetical protein